MSVKHRKFSLDSSVGVAGFGLPSEERGSSRLSGKKFRQSLDDAPLAMQELNRSLTSNVSHRAQTIAEESLERSDEPITSDISMKENKSFHKLFQEIPETEYLIDAFSCTLQKEGLHHGKLFVSEKHVCFQSSALLKDKKVVIPVSRVRQVKKHNSALSMLTIQTADGKKYSFGSLRNREKCSKLLHSICLQTQGESANSSPHLSAAENEADQDVVSSLEYSSLQYSEDHDLSSTYLDDNFPQMFSEGPTRSSSTRQSSLTDEDDRDASWSWRVTERVASLFVFREIRNLSVIFYVYVMLLLMLLLASGYIGLRIIALEEQLNSLVALTDLPSHYRK